MSNKQDFYTNLASIEEPAEKEEQPSPKHLRTPDKSKGGEPPTAEKQEPKVINIQIDCPALRIGLKKTPQQTNCNCRKSQCLKMYCVCFSDGRMCGNGCLCESCRNKNDNQTRSQAINEIITRDPFAFSRALSIHPDPSRDGCNCKRSNCSKKYCECFRKGLGCGKNCFCVDCENSKDANTNFVSKRVKHQ